MLDSWRYITAVATLRLERRKEETLRKEGGKEGQIGSEERREEGQIGRKGGRQGRKRGKERMEGGGVMGAPVFSLTEFHDGHAGHVPG